MADIYAYPNQTDGQGLLGLISYTNNVSDGLLMPLVLLAIFAVVMVVSLYNSRASHAFLISCFLTGILSIPLTILNFLAPSYMYLLGVGLAIGVFWASMDK